MLAAGGWNPGLAVRQKEKARCGPGKREGCWSKRDPENGFDVPDSPGPRDGASQMLRGHNRTPRTNPGWPWAEGDIGCGSSRSFPPGPVKGGIGHPLQRAGCFGTQPALHCPGCFRTGLESVSGIREPARKGGINPHDAHLADGLARVLHFSDVPSRDSRNHLRSSRLLTPVGSFGLTSLSTSSIPKGNGRIKGNRKLARFFCLLLFRVCVNRT